MGLRLEDVKLPVVEIWECNLDAINLFRRYATQWIQGPMGPTGLNYPVLFHDLDRRGIVGDEFDELMDAIRVIESVALEEIHRKEG